MRVRAIINPRAGLKAARAFRAVERGGGAWGPIEMVLTEAPGHAQTLAREAARRGDSVVIAVGGDGTANEVAGGLLGSDTALALVPAGSGNGLARTLGLSLNCERALAALRTGERRRMDVGFANERLFLNVVGAGFDADVAHAFHQRRERGRRGVLGYVRLCLQMVLSHQPNSWRAETEGGLFEGRALIVAVANGRQYGGGARVAPRARLDDGVLDLAILEEAPLLELLWGARRIFVGDLDKLRPYRHLAARRVVIEAATPAYFHRDGEPEEAVSRLEVRVEPKALTVVVPRSVAQAAAGPFALAEG